MSLYLIYGGEAYIDEPRRLKRGDRILVVSTERHNDWDKERASLNKKTVGKVRLFRIGGYHVNVRCEDAGMWPSWRISEKLVRNGMREEEIPFPVKGYRTWRIWKVEHVGRGERQRSLMDYSQEDEKDV